MPGFKTFNVTYYIRKEDTPQQHHPRNTYIPGVGYAEQDMQSFESRELAEAFIQDNQGKIHEPKISVNDPNDRLGDKYVGTGRTENAWKAKYGYNKARYETY